MPLYDYKCPKCGEVTEHFIKHNAPHPHCEHDGTELVKELTIPAFQFKNGVGTDMGNSMAIPGHILPQTE